jgi:hypothetical protein
LNKKIKKFGVFLEKLGFGGDKMGILGIWVAGGGWVRWRTAGGGVLVVGEAVGGGGCGYFGFREKMDGGGVSGNAVRPKGKNEGKKGGEGDLKAGLDGPKTEYVRTYIGTFDRTRAGE